MTIIRKSSGAARGTAVGFPILLLAIRNDYPIIDFGRLRLSLASPEQVSVQRFCQMHRLNLLLTSR